MVVTPKIIHNPCGSHTLVREPGRCIGEILRKNLSWVGSGDLGLLAGPGAGKVFSDDSFVRGSQTLRGSHSQ